MDMIFLSNAYRLSVTVTQYLLRVWIHPELAYNQYYLYVIHLTNIIIRGKKIISG